MVVPGGTAALHCRPFNDDEGDRCGIRRTYQPRPVLGTKVGAPISVFMMWKLRESHDLHGVKIAPNLGPSQPQCLGLSEPSLSLSPSEPSLGLSLSLNRSLNLSLSS